jgi:rhamnosyltransferase
MNSPSNNQFPQVAVLLATHNPDVYIDQQIESIISQVGVKVTIYWGDYGSTEPRKEYVRQILSNCDFKEFVVDLPGPAANFFLLLEASQEEYVAFADQDDIWLPNKLIQQVNDLMGLNDTPGLSHSTSDVLLGGERVKRNSICRGHDFSSLAYSNCCQGCTVMINSAARASILQSLPENLVWHDWWVGLIVSLCGKILYTNETQVLYRIHSNNSIGLPNRVMKFKRFLNRPSGLVAYQVLEALRRFESLYPQNRGEMKNIADCVSKEWKKRFIANLKRPRHRTNLVDELLHRISWVVKQP